MEVDAADEDLERLGGRIVALSARLQAATYHLLVLIREFDERGGWGLGFHSCAHWLNYQTGLDMGAAREKVRVARALAGLPLISAALRQGRISYSKVRALTRVAAPDCEKRLLGFALVHSATHTERLVSSWRRVDQIAEAERDVKRRSARFLTMHIDDYGMLVVKGRLDPETGAVFRRAIEAATDRLYEEARRVPQSDRPGMVDEESLEQRWADALALVAESALTADLDPGTSGDRYQVVVHVDAAVLKEMEPGSTGAPGMAVLEDTVDVSAETCRRMSCDCATVTMTHDADGNTLNVGRKTRTISPAMRRSLRYRDRSCRFPGCGVTVCDGHHVRHWADGGETKLDNLVLLCRRHHRAVHEEGFRVELASDGEARFYDPCGRHLPQAPTSPELDGRAWELHEYAAPDGVRIDNRTGAAECGAGSLDYGLALDLVRYPCWDAQPAPDVSAETSGSGCDDPADRPPLVWDVGSRAVAEPAGSGEGAECAPAGTAPADHVAPAAPGQDDTIEWWQSQHPGQEYWTRMDIERMAVTDPAMARPSAEYVALGELAGDDAAAPGEFDGAVPDAAPGEFDGAVPDADPFRDAAPKPDCRGTATSGAKPLDSVALAAATDPAIDMSVIRRLAADPKWRYVDFDRMAVTDPWALACLSECHSAGPEQTGDDAAAPGESRAPTADDPPT